jgi:hypothetical protein
MLFPNDLEKARAYAARAAGQGLLPAAEHIYRELSVEERAMVGPALEFNRLRDAVISSLVGAELSEAEIKDAYYWGSVCGKIVEYMWRLAIPQVRGATWGAAIQLLEEHLPAGSPGTKARFYDELKRFEPVLHYWGAWCIRGSKFKGPSPGYSINEDLAAFVTEAMIVFRDLEEWEMSLETPSRRLNYESAFGPWDGCQPFQPSLAHPHSGAVPVNYLTPDELKVIRRRGRPPKNRPFPPK